MDYIAPFQMLTSTVKHLQLENGILDIADTKYSRDIASITRKLQFLEKREDQGFYLGAVELGVSVVVRDKEAPEEAPKCKIDIVLEGGFVHKIDDMPEDRVKSMMLINGVTALYSIARAIILSVTSQTFADGGAVVLPMINVVAYCAAQEQAQREKETESSQAVAPEDE